jgi:hypothetical protein
VVEAVAQERREAARPLEHHKALPLEDTQQRHHRRAADEADQPLDLRPEGGVGLLAVENPDPVVSLSRDAGTLLVETGSADGDIWLLETPTAGTSG